MVWLIQDQVLLVCDYKNALRVVNLEDNDVSTICEGQYSNNPTFRTGGLDKCQVNSPLTAKVIDGVIYIGDSSGPETNRAGHILTLTYSQPKCYPPEAKDLKNVLSFTPNKNEYINKDSIKFRCDNGYGVNSSYDTVTCVRALFDNGTVYGVWDKPLPVCKEAALLKLEPKKGQQSGGTIITLTGIFTEEPQIFVAQEQVLEFTRESTQTITFYMPESQSGLGAVDVEVLLGNPSSESYEYLPNPAVRSINRNSAISREGLEIFFKGNNFDSAYNHTLVFSSVSTSVRAVTNCQLGTSGKTLSCITPDFSEFFDGKAKRSVTTGVEFLTLTATLLLDGKAHIGGQFDFTISDTEPTFDTFKQIMKFDLWNKTTIDLTGSNLDTSLMISDYTVYLKFVESGTQLLCDVTRISQATVVCQPPLNSITIPAHTPNLLADLQVSVAGKNYTIGKVKFFISHVASPVKVDPPSTGLVDIVVPVVVTAVVIIIALLAYLLYKRKQPRPPISQLPRYEDDGNGGLEMILPCELRIKLNDIYIDSSKLSFNPKSEPIGRGW
ncbi:PLXNB1 [Bugula neritina]|uniref:PLXNB1 n=1 Tax=Bugula neritina TaxID=10212 RepID=A0A7J7J6J5_BUGNE|nr:PLXNB1 [Bugula neritina]